MTFDEWLNFGIAQGWCSEPDCMTHNGLPNTDEEAEAWEAGLDPCEVGMRIWMDNI